MFLRCRGLSSLPAGSKSSAKPHRISPGQPDYSAADHIMGWKYKRAAQIDMDLAQHVATELKNEAAIAKEARKAKEEQSHRRPQPKAKAKGEGAKDA